jgi:phosphate transport system protein
MIRSRFDQQLSLLNDLLIEMGGQAEIAISMALDGLKKQNPEFAEKAIYYEREIDRKEKDIEALCLKLLLQQHPVAKDLRLVSAVLKMITDMERIGDQAADIAEISLHLMDRPYIKKLEHIPMMATAAIKMVTTSIDAFVKSDLHLAREVIAYDDVVDDLFVTVRNDLVNMIHADSENGEQAIDLIMIAKYLERIGDHAVNVAEWVIFSITGDRKSDYEEEGESPCRK